MGPEPVCPNWPYCQTMWPAGSTRTTRLSATPSGACGITPAGVPVPAMRVNGPTRWTSFTPMMDRGEKSFGPSPNDQTMLPAGVTSITRLLNWSAMRMLPGRLKSRLSLNDSPKAGPAGSKSPAHTSTAQRAVLRRGLAVPTPCGRRELMVLWQPRPVWFPRASARARLRKQCFNIITFLF